MAKTRTYTIINNRIQFKCPSCGLRKYLAISPELRRRTVRCQNCGERTSCLFNRRGRPRDNQAGKAILVMRDGKEIDIDLHDISMAGVGFDLPLGLARRLSLRQVVSFKCKWNQTLIGSDQYVIRSIQGRRVGVEKVA